MGLERYMEDFEAGDLLRRCATIAWCCRGVSGTWPYLEGDGVRYAELVEEEFDLTGVENISWYFVLSDRHLN